MPKSGEVKCLGCSRWLLISGIQTHLRCTQECKMKYSQSAFSKLLELCEAEKKKKTSERKAKNYQTLKQQKNVVVRQSLFSKNVMSN